VGREQRVARQLDRGRRGSQATREAAARASARPRRRRRRGVRFRPHGRGTYGYHYVSHADLEPQNCTAWHKGDSVEIWAPTQTPQAAVDAIAKLAGLPKDKVLLHQLRGGGGFGRRLANDSVCEAVLISKQAGNLPVKGQWMREDDMAFDYYRAAASNPSRHRSTSKASSRAFRTTSSPSRWTARCP
jgi:CO/xanthine dehydrogenase Mo-binding subunit